MFYANDVNGVRVNIDSAEAKGYYFCPACNSPMSIKRGDIVAHHFAHKTKEHCDPWYTAKMTPWHLRMQRKFPSDTQEVIVYNEDRTEFHIADIFVNANGKKYVFEFQHSHISGKEFIARTRFYLNAGCYVVWVFDYQDSAKPKAIMYEEDEYSNRLKHTVWPGRDRVRIFDSVAMRAFLAECHAENKLSVLFNVSTGPGKKYLCQHQNGFQSYMWEYINPINRESYFIRPVFSTTGSLADFQAAFFTEDEIDIQIRKILRSVG